MQAIDTLIDDLNKQRGDSFSFYNGKLAELEHKMKGLAPEKKKLSPQQTQMADADSDAEFELCDSNTLISVS